MKIKDIFSDIVCAFDGSVAPSEENLACEYNSLIKTLSLMLPESDSVLVSSATDGVIETSLEKSQIKRVTFRDGELLRASDTLRELLPSSRLFTPHDNKIFVTVKGECKVFYRSLPESVTKENLESAVLPLADSYIPLVRAWLLHRAYLYVGDVELADVYATEYNRLLEVYCKENGV